MSEVTYEVLKAHLKELEKHDYIVLPKGASTDFENQGWGFQIETDKPYGFSIYEGKYGSWSDKHGEPYITMTVEGFFGEDEYVNCCLEDLSDEEMLRFQPANEEQSKLMQQFKDLTKLVEEAADAANKFSRDNDLGEEVEWSADAGTIANWNSSRC